MSVNKFRFVSPGVFVNEIDNSQLPRAPEEMGPAIIGRAMRGPVMRPVKVQSFSDFVEVFGEPVAGGVGADVWRDGNHLAPTYGAYAAQAYLKNSGGLTFVRLAGFENESKEAGGEAGWKENNAYGLFVMPISGSGDDWTTNGAAPVALAAIIYASGSDYGLSGKELSGSATVDKQLNKFIRAGGQNLEFRLVVDNVEKKIDFNNSSKNYIRSVLNTNPVATNANLVASPEDYFLGETFDTWVKEKLGSINGTSFAAALVKLNNSTAGCDFANFKKGAEVAESGWIVSQHKEATGSFSADASSGEYPVAKLFKLVGLTEGEWNSRNLKVSIEDIKAPANEYVKFGTFSVVVRKIQDNDLTRTPVETFTGLTLDPFSENYIAKRIGDKYTSWDYEKKEFVEYGDYNNQSKFVRVHMNPEWDGSDADLLPYGFYGPAIMTGSVVSGTTVTAPFLNTSVAAANAITASFLLPELPMLLSASDSAAGNAFESVYFGFKTTISNSKRYNEDVVDHVRQQPVGFSGPVSFLFSLDEISGSVSGSTLQRTKPVAWVEGSRKNGTSLSAIGSGSLVLKHFNRFTVPLVGGSDGVDITEKDPFCKRVLSNGSEYTNYAYNSVKVAIESISDPEVAEINLAAIPGIDNDSLTGLLIDKCEMRGDALAVIDLDGDYVPETKTKPNVATVISNMKQRAVNSSYGCAFFPWVLIRDTINNNTVWVPPSVAALGTFSSSQKRTELWFAPAGFNRGGLTDGAAGLPVVQTALRLSSKDRDDLYGANINPIASFPAEGIVIFGQKTLQVTPSALDRINVRRLMIYLKKEISRMARVVLFDPNIQVTWKRFTNQAVPFLSSVQSRFGLSDFKVVLDETTTTPELVDRNIVYAKILLKPTRAIEFIALDFVLAPTGASFND